MIVVRVMDEGQFELPDTTRADLEARDTRLLEALDADDQIAYSAELAGLLEFVRTNGVELALDVIKPSEFVLPNSEFSMTGVRDFLAEQSA
jgi:hypothetical protein